MLHLFLLAFIVHAGDMGQSLDFGGQSSYGVTLNEENNFLDQTPFATSYGESDSFIFNGEFTEGAYQDWKNCRFQIVAESEESYSSPPQAIHIEEDGRFWGTILFPKALRQKVRFQIACQSRVSLNIFDIEAFSRKDTEPKSSGVVRIKAQKQQAQEKKFAPPKIIMRRDWFGDFRPRQAYEMQQPDRLTFHHSAGRQTGGADTLKELKAIQRMHTDPPEKGGRGWNDVAYHFFVDAAGNIFEGRPAQVVGAHAGSKELNKDNIGVCLLGYFHPPKNDSISNAQHDGFLSLMSFLASKYSITSRTIYEHRNLKSTECPGQGALTAFTPAKK